MTQPKQLTFTRIVTVVNPKATHVNAGLKRMKRIGKLFPESKVYKLQASSGGHKAMRHLLKEHAHLLGNKTLLCIVGGDGTVNKVIETLLTFESLKKVRRTRILPLWGGNANDLAVMLNGLAMRLSLQDLFLRGKIVPVYPLECLITFRGKTTSHFATNYISFGASARAAQRLNEPAHRKSKLHHYPGGRILKEMFTTMKAFMDSPIFSVKESGTFRPVYERVYANGSRIARLNSLPVKLSDKQFYQVRVETRQPLLFLRRIVDIFYRRRPHTHQKKPARFTVTADTVLAQFDGESIPVPKDAEIIVRLARRPFYALATKL